MTGLYQDKTSLNGIEYMLDVVGEENVQGEYTRLTLRLFYRAASTRSGTLSHRLTVNDTTVSATREGFVLTAGTWVSVGDLPDVTLLHELDGTCTAHVSASATLGGVSFAFERSFALTTLDVASKLYSVSDAEAGGELRVSYLPHNEKFTHRLGVKCGTWETEYALTEYVGGTQYVSLALPAEAATGVTDAASARATATLYTYLDGVRVGNARVMRFTLTVPDTETFCPSVSLTLTPEAKSPLGGLFLQGKTRIAADVAASGAYGASVVKESVVLQGQRYAAPFLVGPCSETGEVTVVAEVTDSRGLVGSATATVTVLPYEPPHLMPVEGHTAVVASRAENGVAGRKGEQLYLAVRAAHAPVIREGAAQNACTLEFRISPLTGGEFSAWDTLPADGQVGVVRGITLDPTQSYVVQLRATDTVGESAILAITIPTEQVAFHLKRGGKGAAFGKYAEQDRVLEIAPDWTLRLHGNLDDTVTLVDTAANGMENAPTLRITLTGGTRVALSFSGEVEVAALPMTLAEGVVEESLAPSRDVHVLAPAALGRIAHLTLTTAGTLTLDALTGGENLTPFTLEWVDARINYERRST